MALLKEPHSLTNKLKKIVSFDYRIDDGNASLIKRFLFKFVHFCTLVIKRFLDDQCPLKASALTFVSLISLVPFLAFILSLSKGLGAEKALDQKINAYIFSLPGGEIVSSFVSFQQSLVQRIENMHFPYTNAKKELLSTIESFRIDVSASRGTVNENTGAGQQTGENAIPSQEARASQNYVPSQDEVQTAIKEYKTELSENISYLNFMSENIKKDLITKVTSTVPSIPSNISMNAFLYKTQIMEFVNRTSFGYLGAIGLLFLLFVVIKTFGTIEKSFNDIWRIRKSRSIYRKFTDYTSMLIIIPILLLASTTVTAVLTNEKLVNLLNKIWIGKLYLTTLGLLLPVIALWLAFISVYIFLPNTKVKIIPGVIGGMVGGTLFYVLQIFYFRSQVGLSRYNIIYGAFAAIPFFLFWLQMSWTVVLFGSELSFVIQHIKGIRQKNEPAEISSSSKELLGLIVMERISTQFIQGKDGKWTDERLAEALNVPIETILDIIQDLMNASLLVEIPTEKQTFYLPAKDVDSIYVYEVLQAMRNSGEKIKPVNMTVQDQKMVNLIEETQTVIHEKMQYTMKDISQT